jgi:hypothetical protein
MTRSILKSMSLSALILGTTALYAVATEVRTIGSVTAVIAEASTADEPGELIGRKIG